MENARKERRNAQLHVEDVDEDEGITQKKPLVRSPLLPAGRLHCYHTQKKKKQKYIKILELFVTTSIY